MHKVGLPVHDIRGDQMWSMYGFLEPLTSALIETNLS